MNDPYAMWTPTRRLTAIKPIHNTNDIRDDVIRGVRRLLNCGVRVVVSSPVPWRYGDTRPRSNPHPKTNHGNETDWNSAGARYADGERRIMLNAYDSEKPTRSPSAVSIFHDGFPSTRVLKKNPTRSTRRKPEIAAIGRIVEVREKSRMTKPRFLIVSLCQPGRKIPSVRFEISCGFQATINSHPMTN
jgi:hypothetical protein